MSLGKFETAMCKLGVACGVSQSNSSLRCALCRFMGKKGPWIPYPYQKGVLTKTFDIFFSSFNSALLSFFS